MILKLIQYLDNIDNSELHVKLNVNCSILNNGDLHCKDSFIIQVKFLNESIKIPLRYELYEYIHDNSLFNFIYPIIIIMFFIYIAIVLSVLVLLKHFKLYEPELELAELEQYLEKYFFYLKLDERIKEIDQESTVENAWSRIKRFFKHVYDSIFKKSEASRIIKRINENCKKIKLKKCKLFENLKI